MNADELSARLRQWETPIIARVEDGRVLLDLRTVEPEQEAVMRAALESISGAKQFAEKLGSGFLAG